MVEVLLLFNMRLIVNIEVEISATMGAISADFVGQSQKHKKAAAMSYSISVVNLWKASKS
jgi:hypothetical protein